MTGVHHDPGEKSTDDYLGAKRWTVEDFCLILLGHGWSRDIGGVIPELIAIAADSAITKEREPEGGEHLLSPQLKLHAVAAALLPLYTCPVAAALLGIWSGYQTSVDIRPIIQGVSQQLLHSYVPFAKQQVELHSVSLQDSWAEGG